MSCGLVRLTKVRAGLLAAGAIAATACGSASERHLHPTGPFPPRLAPAKVTVVDERGHPLPGMLVSSADATKVLETALTESDGSAVLDVAENGSVTARALPPYSSPVIVWLGARAGEDIVIPAYRFKPGARDLALSLTHPRATNGSVTVFENGFGTGPNLSITGTASTTTIAIDPYYADSVRTLEIYGTVTSAGHLVEVSGATTVATLTTAVALDLLPIEHTPVTVRLEGMQPDRGAEVFTIPRRDGYPLWPQQALDLVAGSDGTATQQADLTNRVFADDFFVDAIENLGSALVSTRLLATAESTDAVLSFAIRPPAPLHEATLTLDPSPPGSPGRIVEAHLVFHWEFDDGTEDADFCAVMPDPFVEGSAFVFLFDPLQFPTGAPVPPMPAPAPRLPSDRADLRCYAFDETVGRSEAWRAALIGSAAVPLLRTTEIPPSQGGFSVWF